MDEASQPVVLEHLEGIAPGLHFSQAAVMRFSCTAELMDHGHESDLVVVTRFLSDAGEVTLRWSDGIQPDELYKFADVSRRVDWGAQAMAILLIHRLMGYEVVEQSRTRNGFDYFLSRVGTDPDLPLNDTLRLEISGIHAETSGNTLEQRVNRKIKRLERFAADDGAGTDDAPALICVVDFARPRVLAVTT